MKKVILSWFLATLSAVAWALPTVQDVEAEVRQGRYVQAESMMREVVAAKPQSAKAHYLYAEILAHDGKVALAAEEARKARQLDPDVKFTDPEKFRSFEAALLQAQRPAARTAPDSSRARATAPAAVAPAPAPASAGIPSWMWVAGLAVVGFLLWRGFSRSRNAAAGAMAAPAGGVASPGSGFGPGAPGAQGTPYGPGYPPAGYPPQRSGMLGTGLAAAGGVAAGMLASELLHRRQGHDVDDASAGQPGFFDSPGNAGGPALEDRPIDFGSGGDWDSGASDAGGGSDGGGWD